MLTKRQSEALRHDVSLCVTAGAGTGKTHVLVNRYIKLIEEAGCRPAEILALTFTEKAAAEMKERVERDIFEKSGPFWEMIKEEMMWANISTFHSFCSKVLREFSIEAGIDPGFSVLSENESEEIISDAITSLFSKKPDDLIKKSLDDCLCAYGTYYLEIFLRELHRQRRYSGEFFEKLNNNETEVLEEWRCALLYEKYVISQEFKKSPVLTEASDALLSLAESFSGDGDKAARYLKNIKKPLMLLKSDDPSDICKGLLGILQTSGGSRNMGSKKVLGDLKEVLCSSYSALKEYSDELPADILSAEVSDSKIKCKKNSGVFEDEDKESKTKKNKSDDENIKRTLKILKSLGVVYNKIEHDIRREKHIRGAIDFTDMINLTYRLFKDYPYVVAKSYARRFKFIMIDEFQDTDPVQAEITSAIIEMAKDESDEETKTEKSNKNAETNSSINRILKSNTKRDINNNIKFSQKSDEDSRNTNDKVCNRLFVVGDPKQSIYLFRSADVSEFKRSGEIIKNEYKGELVSLDINFRSTKEILSFVNCLFGKLLKDSGKPWDFSYEPVSVCDAREKHKGSVELIISSDAKKASERAVLEAEAAAKKIRMIKDEGKTYVYEKGENPGESKRRKASWGDISVLIERRNNLKYIEYALKKYGIPYRVYGGLGLYEKQEILDAKSVLSFLKNPDDDISLYAALRSPWFGFSDAELFRICGGYANGLFLKLKQCETKKAKSAYEMLSSWLLCARKISPSELFRQILNESGILAVYAGQYDGAGAIANLEKISDTIREREKGGFYTLDRLVLELSLSVSSKDREGEAEAEDIGEDAVLVMTVHASKGLEFPIVIMSGLSETPPFENSSIIVDKELGTGIKIPDFESGDDYINSLPLSIQRYRLKQKSDAESKRLFYVAATRARDHLIMCTSEPKKIPASFEACKTRTDWIMFFLFSEIKDEIRDGLYDTGKGDGENFSSCKIIVTRAENLPEIKVKSDANSMIPADIKRIVSSEDFKLNNRDLKNYNCSAKRKDSSSKVFSATEIEVFLNSPARHKEIYINMHRENPLFKNDSKKTDEGKIIHAVFSGETFDSSFEKYRGFLTGDENISQKKAEFENLYRIFMQSDFMKDSLKSYCEVSFTTEIKGFRFSGSIDRLVQKSDGWYIIDYKTGSEKDDSDYVVQMAVYKKAAFEILKEEPKTFVYHTKTGEFTEISPDFDSVESDIVSACEKITKGSL